MVVVAGGRPRSRAVNLVVGDGNTVRGTVAEDNVLATDQGGLDVVDPNEVGAVQRDSITSPDVLGVQVRDVNLRLSAKYVRNLAETQLTFWMMTFLAELVMRRPLPLITPAEPLPMIDLLLPTIRGLKGA